MDKYEINWKDYYEILQIGSNADSRAIDTAYKWLADLYNNLQSDAPAVSEYTERKNEVDEAFQVLSDPIRRAKYDRMYQTVHDGAAKVREPVVAEIADLIKLGTQDVPADRGSQKRRKPALNRAVQALTVTVVIFLLFILVGGTSFAFAQPQHVLAKPFKGIAFGVTEASSGVVSLIEDIRRVTAFYERNVVSSSLQSMRVIEGLKEVPEVFEPTNDMSYFPSRYYPLYPDYLDKRFSQFKYTVDCSGIIEVDVSGATTDALMDEIEQWCNRLAQGE